MALPFTTKVKHCILIMTDKIQLPHDPEYMRLLKDMSDYDTALARLQDSAQRAVSKGTTDSAIAAQVNDAVATAQAQAVTDMNAVADTLDSYAGTPATVATPDTATTVTVDGDDATTS